MKRFPAYIFITDGWDLPDNPNAKEYKMLKQNVGEDFVKKVEDAILNKGYLDVCAHDIINLLEGKKLPALNEFTGFELSNKTWSDIQRKMQNVA